MNKPTDYDNISISSTQIPAGGYVCGIVEMKETKSKSGRDMLEIHLDIAEGEYRGHFMKCFREDTRPNKKWGCVYRILTQDGEGNTNRDFKRFCVSVEKSNQGFEIPWGDRFCEGFRGKLLGVLFGREQFMGNNGYVWSCKPKYLRSANTIREGKYEIPEDKPFEAQSNTQTPQSYSQTGNIDNQNNGFFFTTSEDANAEDLPF